MRPRGRAQKSLRAYLRSRLPGKIAVKNLQQCFMKNLDYKILKYNALILLFVILIFLVIKFLPYGILFFAIFIIFFIGICAWDWFSLITDTATNLRSLYIIIILSGLLLSIYIEPTIIFLLSFCLLIWGLFAIVYYQLKNKTLGFQYQGIKTISGFFLLIAFGHAIITLIIYGFFWLLSGCLIITTADIANYFIGRQWGKHPFISKVSPNKTWEGFLGGLILGLLTSIIISYFFSFTLQERLKFYVIAIFTILFSEVGDLLIHLLRRLINHKHLVILNRIDPFIGGLIVFALGSIILN